MKASEVLAKLERIRDNESEREHIRDQASFWITEVMEDMIDRGDFDVGDPEDYLSEITPPPHDVEVILHSFQR